MILRPFTLICFAAAAGSGLYLYQTKHQAQLLERNIARTMKATDEVRQRAGLLRAEYQMLNDPERLADLSSRLLPGLKTTAPAQFTAMADLDDRLPPVGAAPKAAPLEPDAPDAVVPRPAAPKVDAPKPETMVKADPPAAPKADIAKADIAKADVAKADAPKADIAKPARVETAKAEEPRPEAVRPAAPAPRPRPAAVAAAELPPVATSAPVAAPAPLVRQAAQPRPAAQPVPLFPSAPARTASPRPVSVAAASPRAPMAPAAGGSLIRPVGIGAGGGVVTPAVAPIVASALGMARTLSPISQAHAATFGMNGGNQ